MKEKLITDFLHYNKIDNSPKKYLELPVFDNKYNLKKNIIFYKKWNNYEKKLSDIKKNLKLYDHFLDQLTIFLNNYHKKNYSKRFWSIILGQWLYKFISAISFRWNLINSLKKKNYIFLQKEINTKDIIPLGIEDYMKIANSDYWNHYYYSKIIEHSFSNKFYIKKEGKIIKNYERELIYQKLENKNFREKISLYIQKILNFLPQNKNTLIFSTYMSNLQEVKLNLLVNKSLLYYKTLRPYLLFEKKNLFKVNRKNFQKLKSSKNGLENFLSIEILNCLPSTYLENFDNIGNIVNKIPFPKSPKKIFTTLGIYRSTLMDRYIARNVENGSSLIIAQHGGAYFQHKFHFSSIHEVKISDKYLSWGNIKKSKVIPIGVIKNLSNNFKRSNKIILEVRKRTGYVGEIKIDSGFLDSKKYFNDLCAFFRLLKGNKICENLFIKLHPTNSFWHEEKQFLSHNPELKFLDERKSMIKEISSAKLIIHTFYGTGHLECLAINKPTLILFAQNLNLLDNKSKNYIKKFMKLGIVHRTPQNLFKMLESLERNNSIEKWWNLNKRQNLLKKYRNDFGFFNKEKISNLKDIINEK
tara:strand:- start:1205 stop:2956 length:1752 start_codon:yes stop_codon:yes gene_type:complete